MGRALCGDIWVGAWAGPLFLTGSLSFRKCIQEIELGQQFSNFPKCKSLGKGDVNLEKTLFHSLQTHSALGERFASVSSFDPGGNARDQELLSSPFTAEETEAPGGHTAVSSTAGCLASQMPPFPTTPLPRGRTRASHFPPWRRKSSVYKGDKQHLLHDVARGVQFNPGVRVTCLAPSQHVASAQWVEAVIAILIVIISLLLAKAGGSWRVREGTRGTGCLGSTLGSAIDCPVVSGMSLPLSGLQSSHVRSGPSRAQSARHRGVRSRWNEPAGKARCYPSPPSLCALVTGGEPVEKPFWGLSSALPHPGPTVFGRRLF